MKKIAILSLFIILLLSGCFKPTDPEEPGGIKGIVRDALTFLPIPNVNVSITDGATVTTNSEGEYSIDDLVPKNYELHFAKSGYLDNTASVNVTSSLVVQKDVQMIPVMPELSANTDFVNFDTNLTTATIVLSNKGTGQINWSIANTENWLQINPVSGTITGGTTPVTLTVNRSGLNPGNYSTNLTITSNANSLQLGVLMTIPNTNVPLLSLSPTFLDFGVSTSTRVLAFNNNGVGTSTWTITSSQSWISFSPANGNTQTETDHVTVNVNRSGLQPGTYNGSLDIVSNSGNYHVPISMDVSDLPVIDLSTYSLDFGQTTMTRTVTITNVGNGTLAWQTSSDAYWLSAAPASGTGNGSITVNVNRSGMAEGNYSGNVLLTSNGGNRTIEVTMCVPSTLPDGVTLLFADMVNQTTARINWTVFVGSGFASYRVYRGTSPNVNNSNGTMIAELTAGNQNSFDDTQFQPQTQYYYNVYVKTTQNYMIPSQNILGLITPPALGQWTALENNTSRVYALDMYNSNFGMAIAYYNLYIYAGGSWNQDVSIYGEDIVVISPTCAYTNRQHYNGVEWTNLPYQGYGVEATDENHVWIGRNGGVRYFDGSTWTSQSFSGSAANVYHIDALSDNLVYAVMYKTIYKFDGSDWNQVYTIGAPATTTAVITDIEVLADGDFWITLDEDPGRVFHFVNDNPSQVWEIGYVVNCVDAVTANDIWFGGDKLWHWDGHNLLEVCSAYVNFIVNRIEDISMVNSNIGWAGLGGIYYDNDGVFMKYQNNKKRAKK